MRKLGISFGSPAESGGSMWPPRHSEAPEGRLGICSPPEKTQKSSL